MKFASVLIMAPFLSIALCNVTAAEPPPSPIIEDESRKTYVETKGDIERMEKLESRLSTVEARLPAPWYRPIILSGILAALSTALGAALGYMITRRLTLRAEERADKLQRTDSAIDIADEWIKLFPRLGRVNDNLNEPEKLRDNANLNVVLEYGNWLEVVAQRSDHGLLDDDFLKKLGLSERMTQFQERFDQAAGLLANADPPKDISLYAQQWTALSTRAAKRKEKSDVTN